MHKRYASVRQRSMWALVKALENIKQENGFNTTVNSVQFTQQVPPVSPEDGNIEILVLTSTDDWRANQRIYTTVNLEIHYSASRTQNQDVEWSLILNDIQELLKNGLTDTLHPNPINTGIWFELIKEVPRYQDIVGNGVGGFLEYDMTFWSDQNNRNLWDSFEDRLVEIESE